jgi:hypothetical protein
MIKKGIEERRTEYKGDNAKEREVLGKLVIQPAKFWLDLYYFDGVFMFRSK